MNVKNNEQFILTKTFHDKVPCQLWRVSKFWCCRRSRTRCCTEFRISIVGSRLLMQGLVRHRASRHLAAVDRGSVSRGQDVSRDQPRRAQPRSRLGADRAHGLAATEGFKGAHAALEMGP